MDSGYLRIQGGAPPRLVGKPSSGKQHLGYPPGGAQDQTSASVVNLLLGQEFLPCLELMFPPFFIKFQVSGWMALAGADFLLELDGDEVSSGTLLRVDEGSELHVKSRGLGSRLYLQMSGGIRQEDSNFLYFQKEKKPNEYDLEEPDWWPSPGSVRFIPGPEWDWIESSDFESIWKIDVNSNDQGLRLGDLVSGSGIILKPNLEMVSGPVFDGTVQVSPSGPILLLRNRQCVGGYPRVLQVIQCDIDRLAQFLPGQLLRFERVTLQEAEKLNDQYSQYLKQNGRIEVVN